MLNKPSFINIITLKIDIKSNSYNGVIIRGLPHIAYELYEKIFKIRLVKLFLFFILFREAFLRKFLGYYSTPFRSETKVLGLHCAYIEA